MTKQRLETLIQAESYPEALTLLNTLLPKGQHANYTDYVRQTALAGSDSTRRSLHRSRLEYGLHLLNGGAPYSYLAKTLSIGTKKTPLQIQATLFKQVNDFATFEVSAPQPKVNYPWINPGTHRVTVHHHQSVR